MEGRGGWLRGRDLNPRPLGYESEKRFLFLLALSCFSVTYFLLVPDRYCWFVLVFVPFVRRFVRKQIFHDSV